MLCVFYFNRCVYVDFVGCDGSQQDVGGVGVCAVGCDEFVSEALLLVGLVGGFDVAGGRVGKMSLSK